MDLVGSNILLVLEIIWINIILSGDNAVVIAMACRGLPADKRRIGLILGAGVAIGLRIVFTVLAATLLDLPFLKIIGSLLLIWIAVKLVAEQEVGDDGVAASDRLWHAVRTVAVADMVMSLDNVLAIAAVAKGSTTLLVIGLAVSIPLIVAGASVIMALLDRLPVLVWAGAGLLGWISGEMLASDPFLVERVGEATMQGLELPVAIATTLLVLAIGWVLTRRAAVRQGHDPAG